VQNFVIRGGNPITGDMAPAGNKNAALAMLAASLLSEGTVRLTNLPLIGDVHTMIELMQTLGADVDLRDREVTIDAANIKPVPLDRGLAAKIRASLLLAAPLLARFGSASLPLPGGDSIGRRRNDAHWRGLEALGVSVSHNESGYQLSFDGPRPIGADVWLDEMSVMATENVLMVAVQAEGTTVIRNAASEPHIQDLCHLLVSMGARISGIGSNLLTIEGVGSLNDGDGAVGPDYMEIGSFAVLAAVTGGRLRIGPVRHSELVHIVSKLPLIGIVTERDGDDLVVPERQELRIREDEGGVIPRLHEAPWPGFPADLMSVALVAATQAQGTVLLHQWMFESRLYFTDRLIEMGARIILADPHRAVVTGPSRLRGAVLQSPDIRAGMALLTAAMCAAGQSRIGNVGQIDRGYESVDGRLRSLGGDIERLG
jgi:UDP-N-acetylglucosamine 1-carboxyvinyltransferase